MNEAERQALGEKTRRTVLGDEHVDRTQARLTGFNDVFQDFITRYAWGEVWTRPEENFACTSRQLSGTV
jgi:alkylhydroperoxidase/carboxymuconolactone decarboxylase family protein YurZ